MLNDYVCWVRDEALPIWADRGFDARGGRFRERLDLCGDPVAVPHRAMVQARQIFVFADAATAGWFPDGGRLAELAMASLLRDFASDDGTRASFAFSIDPSTGATVSAVRDAYAHAFLLFSIAALYRLNGEARLLALADRIIAFVERDLTDPVHGGLFDALPAPAEKRQNPHMHLLEAYLFLADAAPGRGYAERAADLVRLFRRHFFRDSLLLEYFTPDWQVAQHAAWEPGHHFEWVWLLGEYGRLTGERMDDEMEALFASAVRNGVTPENLILDELSPTLAVLKPSRRLWPHTEAIKAAATRHAQGDAAAKGRADDIAGALVENFLDRPFVGGWIDHIGADGIALVDYVPASSFYHLLLGARVAAQGFAPAPEPAKA
jgi:mannose-6-phosphate isomerase